MLRPLAGTGACTRHEYRSLSIFGFALILLAAGALLAPATGLAASTYSSTIQNSPSLEAYWRLGEATGSAADSSVAGTSIGTYVGTPARSQPGAIVDDPNGSVLLNSMDDYVNVPDGPASPLDLHDGPFTLEAWIKRSPPGTSSTFETIISKGGAYGLFLNNDRLVLRQPGVGDIATSNIPIVDSTTWHHVVATKNGTAVKLYIDGADRTGTIAGSVPTLVDSDSPLQIGVTGTNFFPFAGSIDEVAIYREVLTPSDVEAHQRIGTTPNSGRESQLLRYPYLTDVVENYATVNWATDQSEQTGVVRWGRVGTDSCSAPPNSVEATKIPIVVDGTSEYQWKANLTLTPDAEYCYRVYLGDAPEIDLLGYRRDAPLQDATAGRLHPALLVRDPGRLGRHAGGAGAGQRDAADRR